MIKTKEEQISTIMSEEEKQLINNLQQKYVDCIYLIGELSLKKIVLQKQIDAIDNELDKNLEKIEDYQLEEREILKKLDTKYGLSNLAS